MQTPPRGRLPAEALRPEQAGRLGEREYLRGSQEDVTAGPPSPRVRLSPVTPPPDGDAGASGGCGTEATAGSAEDGLGLRLAARRVEPSPEAVEGYGEVDGLDGRLDDDADPLRAAQEARRRAESELRAAREEIAALRRQVGSTARASGGAHVQCCCESCRVVRDQATNDSLKEARDGLCGQAR